MGINIKDGIEVGKAIQECIELLDKGRKVIDETSNNLAIKRAEYSRDLAVTLLKLRNKKIPTFESEPIGELPATVMPKIAAGIVWESELAMEEAEGAYKAAVSKIDSIRAKLNGYQSIFRNLDSI